MKNGVDEMQRTEGLITNLGPKSPVSEAYRTLRTNLEFMSPDQPLKTIVFTSTGPGEGKSTTTANTAISMAQLGKKVLLVDCDLRKPVQHKIFELSNMTGMTNILIEHTGEIEQYIQQTGVQNLELLPSGPIPPNPAEILGSRRMLELLQELSGKYEVILLDTPPLIAVTDAAVLSVNADGVILVVSVGQAERDMVLKAKGLLDKVNARVLGVVLNRVQITKGHEYYYYSKGESHAG